MSNTDLCKILAFLLCGAIGAGIAMEEPFDGCGETTTTEETESKGTVEKGIDVSRFQAAINWRKVAKSGVKHAFVKMTEGGTYVDPKFVQNWNGASGAGIKVNCYHYFRVPPQSKNATSALVDQKNNIKKNLKAVKWNPADNALAIDVEAKYNEKATPDRMADTVNTLLTLIKRDSELSSLRVFIYTSHGYWNTKVNWKKYNFGAHPLWVAHYGVSAPGLPEPWKSERKNWTWWQYSENGKVDGISGHVDLDWVRV